MSAVLASVRTRGRDDRGSVTVWTISAVVSCMLMLALVVDGGTMLRARSDAFALAAAAARAGAQQLDRDAAVQGETKLDPSTAEQAALDYLAAHGATGNATVTARSITVTVHSHAELQLLRGAGEFTATSTVNAIKVEAP